MKTRPDPTEAKMTLIKQLTEGVAVSFKPNYPNPLVGPAYVRVNNATKLGCIVHGSN